jgi:hypothetical protein
MPLLIRTDSSVSSPITGFGILVPRWFAQWLARLWVSIVIVGSLLPGSARVKLHASESTRPQFRYTLTHRLIHFVAFGSSFWVLNFVATKRREQVGAAAEVMAIGCIIELTQYYVYSHLKVFEWWDIRDDAIGVAMAYAFVQIANRIKLAFVLQL